MKLKKFLPYLWKTPVFGFALFLGVMIGNFLASQIGLEAPAGFSKFHPLTFALYLLAISPLLLASLLFLCYFITGRFIAHWLTLALITWGVYSLGTSVGSSSQTSVSGFSPYLIIIFFFASFMGVGALVLMFPEHYKRQERLLIRR
ncbi:MAG: hypothetical protein GTO18_13445 [Anaerolineales bacterium]|nr:hypothetical protein [Anaerolineales bacterium]